MEKHFLRGLCFTLYRLNYSQIFPLTVVLDVPPLPTPAAGGAGCAPRPPGLCGHGFRVNTKDRTAGTAHPQSDRSGGLPQGSKDGCCGTHPPRRAGNSASGPRSPSAVREGRKAVRGSWERVKGRWRGRPAVGSEHVQIATASTLRASVTGALRLSPPPVAGHPWTPVRRGPAAGGGARRPPGTCPGRAPAPGGLPAAGDAPPGAEGGCPALPLSVCRRGQPAPPGRGRASRSEGGRGVPGWAPVSGRQRRRRRRGPQSPPPGSGRGEPRPRAPPPLSGDAERRAGGRREGGRRRCGGAAGAAGMGRLGLLFF